MFSNWLVMALGLLAIWLFFWSAWRSYRLILPQKIISLATPRSFGLNYEDVSLTTQDGVKLKGWFLPAKNNSGKTILLLHGYPFDKGALLASRVFLAEKYNLLFFDFRGLGESDGRYTFVGIKETLDLAAAVDFLKSRGFNEIGAWGFSLGAAVALLGAEKNPEIKAIVSESSYARLDLMAPEIYNVPVLKYLLGKITLLWSFLILGVNPKKISPAASAAQLKIPIFVTHSEKDTITPFEHALILKEALRDNPRAEFCFENKNDHGQLTTDCQNKISEFFDKNL